MKSMKVALNFEKHMTYKSTNELKKTDQSFDFLKGKMSFQN